MPTIETSYTTVRSEPARPDPLAVSILDACRIASLSRSAIYRALASGELRAVKHGTKTLVLMDSLRAHLANLPAATFRSA